MSVHLLLMQCGAGSLLLCSDVVTEVAGGATVKAQSVQSKGDSQLGHYQLVTTWMDDCLQTGKPSRYIINTKVNSAIHPSGVGKSSSGLLGLGYGGEHQVAGKCDSDPM